MQSQFNQDHVAPSGWFQGLLTSKDLGQDNRFFSVIADRHNLS